MDSRSIQDPEPCELCDEELDPNPPRLTLLLPIARLPLRAGLKLPTPGLLPLVR
jgi:hypothetical protein